MLKKLLVGLTFIILMNVTLADFYPYGNIVMNDQNITGANKINAIIYYGNGSQLEGITSTSANSSEYWDDLNTFNSTQMEGSGGNLNILVSWLESLFISDTDEGNLNVNRSDYWDGLNAPTDIPHATPSNGDVTHFSLADEIYDWVIGFAYASLSHLQTNYYNKTETYTQAEILALNSSWNYTTDTTYSHLSNFTDNLGDRGYDSLSNFSDNLGARGYTHLSNFTDNIGVSSDWDELSDLPTATPASGDTTHLSLSSQIYNWVTGLNYKTLTEIVANIGNWSADKSSYYTSTIIDTLGNWSSEKGNYYNSTEVLALNSSWDYTTDTNCNSSGVCSSGDVAYLDYSNSGNFTIDGYYSGQPLHGIVNKGILNISEYENGLLNVSDNGTHVFYPAFTGVFRDENDELIICEMPAGNLSMPFNSARIAIVNSTCDAKLISTTEYLQFSDDKQRISRMSFMYILSGCDSIKLLFGEPQAGDLIQMIRLQSIYVRNLRVISGMDINEGVFPELTQTAGSYVFDVHIPTTTAQNSTSDGITLTYHQNSENFTCSNQTGINLTHCDNGTALIPCSTNQFRRYLFYTIGHDNDPDRTKMHQLAPVDSEDFTNIGNCLDIEATPISYTLPTEQIFAAVTTHIYCGARDDNSFASGGWIDLRAGIAGFGATVDTSVFLTKDGTRPLTGTWATGDNNITSTNGYYTGKTLWANIQNSPSNLAELDTQIGITGTASSSTYWRGDNSWNTPTDTNTNCSSDGSCSSIAYDSEINKTYVDAQDSAQDHCSEITGCVENAITDGNTNWDNSYGFYNSIANTTGTLTNTYWCRYDSAGTEIDCDVVPFSDTNTQLSDADILALGYNHTTDIQTWVNANDDTGTDTQDLSYNATTDVISLTDGGSIDITEVDTNTNANTECSGTTTYLDGFGDCDDLSNVYINEAGDSTGALTSDLNIDLNTLVVDYDTNEVGIGIADPLARLHVNYPASGDIIFQAGTDDGGGRMKAKYGYNGYGWYYDYRGDQSGDANEWQLWSEGAGGADMQVYMIKQSGNIKFYKTFELNTGTSVNDIDTTVANDDNALITSGGVYDGLASQDACSEITGCVENAITSNCSADQSCANVLYTTDKYLGGLSCADTEIAKWNNSASAWECESDETGGDAGGAPSNANYLVGTAHGNLSAEIVVGTTPGGELGGTWASPTIDDSIGVSSWSLTTPTVQTTQLCYRDSDTPVSAFILGLRKARDGDPTDDVSDEDYLGYIRFEGYHTDGYDQGAIIQAVVDNTPGNSDMPSRLEFLTSADGSSNPTLRGVIDSSGNWKFGDGAWTNYLQISNSGAMTFAGTGDINLPDDSVDAGDINTINCGSHCTWDATNDEIDVSDDWYDSVSDIPTATPNNGDTTHLSTADHIFDYIVSLAYATTAYVDSLGNWSADKSSYWNSSTDLDTVIATDEITELKIDFNTVCGEGNHLYVNGNNLACEADDDTTYTAGDGITLTGNQFNHTDTSSQSSSNNAGRTYIQDIILDTYGHITSIVTATETVTDTDTQDLSYDTATDVISLVDGGSVDITEVDTDTHLSEDQVEAYILDSDNTANLDLNNYNITGVSKYKYENAGDNVYTYFNGSCIITVVNSTSFAVCP